MRVVLVLLAALVLAPSAHAWARLPAIDQAAAGLADGPVEVRCAFADEWAADPHSTRTAAAYTWWTDGQPRYVVLAPRTCLALLLLAVDPADRWSSALNPWLMVPTAQAEALVTLAHEAVHMTGVRDEQTAECRAVELADRAAAAFGVPDRRARWLAALAWSRLSVRC